MTSEVRVVFIHGAPGVLLRGPPSRRRSRVVTILVTSRATAGDRDVVWETVGDRAGVTYQQRVNRWRIVVDAVPDA